MRWGLSTDPKSYPDAIRKLRARQVMGIREYEQLAGKAKARGFGLAGIAQADLAQSVMDRLVGVIEGSKTIKEFRAEVEASLAAEWSKTPQVQSVGFRIANIFRTEVNRSYSHARVRQLRQPAVAGVLTHWRFDSVKDGRTSPMCRACGGVILPNDAAWWGTHTPPLHFMCRSIIRGIREDAIAEEPDQKPVPTEDESKPLEGFGFPPEVEADQPPERMKQRAAEPATPAAIAEKLAKLAEQAKPKPEHSAAYWQGHYQADHPPEVAARLAHGRACLERGLDGTVGQLRNAGATMRGPLKWWPGDDRFQDLLKDGDRPVRQVVASLRAKGTDDDAARADTLEALSTMAEHAKAITPGTVRIKAGKNQDGADQAGAFYSLIKDARVPFPQVSYRYTTSRAKFDPNKGIVHSYDARSMVHELGHAFEHKSTDLARLAVAYLEHRTQGEQIARLRDILPKKGYGPGELTKPDKWFNPYVGKEYRWLGQRSGTEILSMALEAWFKGNLQAWRLDRDLLLFALGCMT
jgi:SPP1 gp7 family putative phage head morphogenesis protein